MRRIKTGIILFVVAIGLGGCNFALKEENEVRIVRSIESSTKVSTTPSQIDQQKTDTNSFSQIFNINEKPVVLWNGDPIRQAKYVTGSEIDTYRYTLKEIKDYYERKYTVYVNRKSQGSYDGKIYSNDKTYITFGQENSWNGDQIAISANYNAVPREIGEMTFDSIYTCSLVYGNIIQSINNRFHVSVEMKQALSVDLDGDNVKERIVTLFDRKKGFSASALLTGEGYQIALLSIVRNGVINGKTAHFETFQGEILDIDDDGIMEILVKHFYYKDKSRVRVVKESNNCILVGEPEYFEVNADE